MRNLTLETHPERVRNPCVEMKVVTASDDLRFGGCPEFVSAHDEAPSRATADDVNSDDSCTVAPLLFPKRGAVDIAASSASFSLSLHSSSRPLPSTESCLYTKRSPIHC